MKQIKILLVDDHKMIRDGLRSMLELQTKKHNFLITEAENGEDGIEQIKKANYDLVIMDYQLPKLNGAETTRAMLAYNPKISILGLSNYDESAYVENIMKAGAKGYVLKNIDTDELIKAITTILNGKNYYSNDVAIKLINLNDDDSKNKPSKQTPSGRKLSKKEYDILKLIAEGYSTKQIADKLLIGKRTADKYRQNLLEKMHVNNSPGLLKQARILKLID